MKYVVFRHKKGLAWFNGSIYHSGNNEGYAKMKADEIFSIDDDETLTLVKVISPI
jgi:hypothetical protein